MLENILNIYYYPQKSALTKVADAILWPTNRAFNCHRISLEKGIESIDKCSNIFFRILMGIVAIVLLPISFVAAIIKLCDYTNAKMHNLMKKILTNPKIDDENCFCMDDTKKKEILINLQCQHSFHLECIRNWIKEKNKKSDAPNCPVCRKVIPQDIIKLFSPFVPKKSLDERALEILHQFPEDVQRQLLSGLEELVRDPQRMMEMNLNQ